MSNTAVQPAEPVSGQFALMLQKKPEAIEIFDQESYVLVCEELVAIKAARARVVEYFADPKKKAHEAWQAIRGKEKEQLDKIDAAAELRSTAKLAWDEKQEAIRLENERRINEENARREEEQRLNEAVAAEQQGAAPEEVEAILNETPAPTFISLAPTTPRVSGLTNRSNWKARITDKMALIRYVAQHPEHQGLLDVNTTVANSVARAQKNLMRIPGLQAWDDKGVQSTRRR